MTDKIKILFLSANPLDYGRLRLHHEMREIDNKIQMAVGRHRFELISQWAVTPDDLQQALLRHRPHVVHFSVNDGRTQGLTLEDQSGNIHLLSTSELIRLFKILKDNIRIVVLNAYSRRQAEGLSEIIDYTIGVKATISDDDAILFAASFYQGLAFGRSVKEAFDLANNRLSVEGIGIANRPELLIRQGARPELLIRQGAITKFLSRLRGITKFLSRREARPELPIREIAGQPEPPSTDYYSCFICYSSENHNFAERLYTGLQNEGVRCWFAPEDIKGGQKIHEQLERAIQMHDRLLIVLSEQSMQSEWVMTEIRNARQSEIRENRRKLFPIRLVDFDAIRKWKCFDADAKKDLAIELREYYMPDFSNWKEPDSFELEFKKLLRDLQAGEGK